MNYQKIYEYRFAKINIEDKKKVWNEISKFLYHFLEKPQKVLDPAAGMCEFTNAIPAAEVWAIDLNDFVTQHASSNVKTVIGNIFQINLPQNYFNAIFSSNFLEHLASSEHVSNFLQKMHGSLAPNGVLCVMGPNFKYCMKEYFDCSDHLIPLTHIAVEELLYANGFEIVQSYPRFLPFSFRGFLPPSPFLTKCYLKLPFFWPLLGKQFLILARKIHQKK